MEKILLKTSLFLIKAYQKTLSPDHGIFSFLFPHGVCRFYPTCSEYFYQSINKYGFCQGVMLGMRRLLKCYPGHRCGYDPVK